MVISNLWFKVFKGLTLMVYCPVSEWIRMVHLPEANFIYSTSEEGKVTHRTDIYYVLKTLKQMLWNKKITWDFWGRKQTSKVHVFGISHWATCPDIMPKHPAFTDAI